MNKEEMREFLVTTSLWPPGTLSNTDDLLDYLNYGAEPADDDNGRWVTEWVTQAPVEYLPLILEVISEVPDLPYDTYADAYEWWVWGAGKILHAWGKRDLTRLLQLAAPYLLLPHARPCILYAICCDDEDGAAPAWLPLLSPLVDGMHELPIYDQSLLFEALLATKLSDAAACPHIDRFLELYQAGEDRNGFIDHYGKLYREGKL